MSDLRVAPVYFNNLDALRFFSFFSVFIAHTLFLPVPGFGIKGFLFSCLTLDCLLVPFFFTLSSFLITYRLLTEKENKGRISLKKFYRNRILRIWPAYYLLIIVCFFIIPLLSRLLHVEQMSLPPIMPFLLFFANFFIIEHGSSFTFALLILWSISIEEQFYLTWALLLKYIRPKGICLFIVLLFIFSIIFSYYYLQVRHKSTEKLAIHSLFILQYFCSGAFIAFICVRKKRLFIFLRHLPTAFFVAVYIILITGNYFVQDFVLRSVIKSSCYSLVIYDQAFNARRIFNAGKISFFNYAGKISYGLYLYHAIIFVILQKEFHLFNYQKEHLLWMNLFHMLIAFVITFGVSHLSYKFIETRFLRIKSV